MAYRDEVESRRAHVGRLEAELTRLEEDERHLLSALRAPSAWRDRLAGAPRVVERVLRLPAALDDETLFSLLESRYEVDGRVAREGDTLVWRGDPEPRPRNVEVRIVRLADATELHVRDTGSYRAYAALAALGGLAPQLINGSDTGFKLVMAGVLTILTGLVVWRARSQVRQRARRALMQLRSLERDATALVGSAVDVRVAPELDAPAGSDALDEASVGELAPDLRGAPRSAGEGT